MTMLYVTILVCGVVGNVSTCVVIARNKHMHTATNYYLFSLAISDLLLLLAGLPPEIYHLWFLYPYVFGEVVCVVTGLAAETSANATVLTITAFTVERYVAICHPFLSHAVSKLSRAIKYVVLIWMLALLLAVPQALQLGIVYEVYRNGTIVSEDLKLCTIKHAMGSHTFGLSTVLFFLAPMLLISVLYALIGLRLQRSNRAARREAHGARPLGHGASRRHHAHAGSTRRVVKMLVAVVVAFFICWAPFQAQRLYAVYGYKGDKTSADRVKLYKTMTYASGLLYYLSTTVNPILYNIMSLKFRQAFKSTLTKCCSSNGGKELQSLGVEVCGSGSGGAAVGCGPGVAAGRLQYAVLSRRSSRNNSAASSVNSGAGDPDLTRRPLVVSFRRRSARTSSTSLDCASSPEQKRLHPAHLALVDLPNDSAATLHRSLQLRPLADNCTWTQAPARHPLEKVPRIEDIEIFQESQLKIHRSTKKSKPEAESHSQPDNDHDPDPGDKCCKPSVPQVAKSQTLPCMSNMNEAM